MTHAVGRLARFALVAAFVTPALARAQDVPRTRVRLTVKDSLGVPLSDAAITVLRGLRDTVSTSTTDAAGTRVLFVPRDGAPIQLVVRKIGFARANQFATTSDRDSVSVSVTMQRLVTALSRVTVTEKEDAIRKSYFIDADDIAKSARPILDAADVLLKMRQDMIYSRGGCPSISNLWVNGILVLKTFPPIGASYFGRAKRPMPEPPTVVSEMAKARASVKGSPASVIGMARLTILEEIKPEHIAEISYKDCFDTSMKGNFGQNALFVVLKPGIKYEIGVGSYPMDAPPGAKKH